MKNGHKTGFTLVELLVVIAIIALLMGVLLPALSAARMRAQTIVCAANLKNYGTALFMYADNNNDKAPFSFYWLYSMRTLSNTGWGGCPEMCRWHYDTDPPDGSLWPYLRNIKSHMCPTFKTYAKSMTCWNTTEHNPSLPYNPVYSYSMNRWLGFRPPARYYEVDSQSAEAAALIASEPTQNLSKINRAAECFAFSEENMWTIDHREGDGAKWYSTSGIGKNDLWLYANKAARDSAVANFATYHNISTSKRNEGKANVVFVDGHVSQVRGLAGYDAYFEYGRPYRGHENFLWNFW
jgi:prepilin-type N-terminal cleavage/methylation domain-containing protein/prepilin-type processing-associated H-X9-DG protein